LSATNFPRSHHVYLPIVEMWSSAFFAKRWKSSPHFGWRNPRAPRPTARRRCSQARRRGTLPKRHAFALVLIYIYLRKIDCCRMRFNLARTRERSSLSRLTIQPMTLIDPIVPSRLCGSGCPVGFSRLLKSPADRSHGVRLFTIG
jgi:hypothetical protein